MTLAPYESRVFVFGAQAVAPLAQPPLAALPGRPLDTGWKLAFWQEAAKPLTAFGSWTDLPERRRYSGRATYTRSLALSRADIAAGLTTLDFGPGQPLAPPTARQNGTQALLEPPVREAAEVYVNGKRAGAVWSPPFRLSLRGLLHAGRNRLDIRVANTAINHLSARPPTDYTALNAKYGERFQPQGMDNLAPLPSGILRPPVLTNSQ